jgi:hypothetical protein
VEWEFPVEKFVGEDTHCPNIDFLVVRGSCEDLWRHVVEGARGGPHLCVVEVSIDDLFADTEIDNLDLLALFII